MIHDLIRIMAETTGDGEEMVKMAQSEVGRLMKEQGMVG